MWLCLTAISIDETAVQIAFAGDNTVLTLTGIDSTNLSIGERQRQVFGVHLLPCAGPGL